MTNWFKLPKNSYEWMKLIINIIFYLIFVVGLTTYFDFGLLGIVVLTVICVAVLTFVWKYIDQEK